MKKSRIAVLVLIALLLLTPTGLLIVRAAAVGNFPIKGDAASVRITKPDRSVVTLTEAAPLYGVVYDLFRLTDRVARSKLPEVRETYTLEFNDNGIIETLKLYVAASKGSSGEQRLESYVLSSENRLYRLKLPVMHIRTMTLVPARVDWIGSVPGGEQTLYTYPEARSEYPRIYLLDWGKLSLLSSDQTFESVEYRLYDENDRLLSILTDSSEIAQYSPSYVLCAVKWKILSDSFIAHTYVFDVEDGE